MVSNNLRQMVLCILAILFSPCAARGQFYFPAQASKSVPSSSPGYSSILPTAPVRGVSESNYFAPPQYPRLSMNIDTAESLPAPGNQSGMILAPYAGAPESVPQAESNLSPYPALDENTSDCEPNLDCCVSTPCPVPCSPWYASTSGLVMGRNKPNQVWTTYETGVNANQLMNTTSTNSADGQGSYPGDQWQPGGDVRIGRYFGCSRWALELGYWGIGQSADTLSMTNPSTVSTPLLFQDVEFGPGNPVQTWFDSADEHRLTRTNEFYSFELNFIQGALPYAGFQKFSGRALLGVRYFQFNEDLVFETLDQGGTWGGNGGLDEATLSDSVQNSLIGVQFGYLLEYYIGHRCSVFITPKIGVYNNHIKSIFQLYRGDGTVANPTAFSGVSGSYPNSTSKDIVSFLTEIDLGFRYRLSQRWSLLGGYRVVAINGVGLSDNQIPQYIVDIPDAIAIVDTNGSVVLHGAFFGAAFNY